MPTGSSKEAPTPTPTPSPQAASPAASAPKSGGSWLSTAARKLLGGKTFAEASAALEPGGALQQLTQIGEPILNELLDTTAQFFGLKRAQRQPAAPKTPAPKGPAPNNADENYNNDPRAASAPRGADENYNNDPRAASNAPAPNQAAAPQLDSYTTSTAELSGASPQTQGARPAVGAPDTSDAAPADNAYLTNPDVTKAAPAVDSYVTTAPPASAPPRKADPPSREELKQQMRTVATKDVDPAAERVDEPLLMTIDEKLQAALRKGAAEHAAADPVARTDKTGDERTEGGYATLPLEAAYVEGDKGTTKVGGATFHTVYHGAKDAPAQGGAEQDEDRSRYVFKLTGGLLRREDDPQVGLDTTSAAVSNYTLNTMYDKEASARGITKAQLPLPDKQRIKNELMKEGGRYIYVMNAAGDFFAGKDISMVQHHSSFLAGGAVASAGDITVSAGAIKTISNISGHYKPGPAYLWQACAQLQAHGVDLGGVTVEVSGLKGTFGSAKQFFLAFNPATDARFFDPKFALTQLDKGLLAPDNDDDALAPSPPQGEHVAEQRGEEEHA